MQPIRNLNSIQVFEAAAHFKNVTRTAQFLNVSQSSVSYHIKKLESEVRAVLFMRKPDGLTLTPQGMVLASHVETGLRMIRTGLDKMSAQSESVRFAVLPMFASRWLSSRLGSLWEAHPGLQLSFQNHNNTYVMLDQPNDFADLGIQWGHGGWKDFHVTRLWPETMVVVCSPDYLNTRPIKTEADLARCTLLHVDDEQMWAEWFNNNRLEPPSSEVQMVLEDRHFQLSSTINGLGVSLFAQRMIESELKSGVLVNPFGRTFDTSFAYHLVVPKGAILSKTAVEFREWLLGFSRLD